MTQNKLEELKMHPKIKSMYERMPETLTGRFKLLNEDGEGDSLVFQHRSVNVNLELAAINEYATGQLRATANLYAPLAKIQSPKEGIEALRTLENLEQRLHLNGFRGTFGHYDEGVEFTYDFRVESPTSLQRALREFSFIPYNFVLNVELHPRTTEQGRAINQKVGSYLDGEIGVFGTSYEAKNPTAKIMGWSHNTLQNALSVLRTGSLNLLDTFYLEFWSEDEQTSRRTEDDFQQIAQDVVRLYGDFKLTTDRKVRKVE